MNVFVIYGNMLTECTEFMFRVRDLVVEEENAKVCRASRASSMAAAKTGFRTTMASEKQHRESKYLWVDLGKGLIVELGAVVEEGGMIERYWMTLLVLEGRQCSVSGRDRKRLAIGEWTRDRISRAVHGCQCIPMAPVRQDWYGAIP
jgi:hypothetical protein